MIGDLTITFFKELIDLLLKSHDARQAEIHYLEACIEQSKNMGRDWVPQERFLVDILRAFIPLPLTNEQGTSEPLSDALRHHKRIVIQGPPGAGKSTLVNYLTLLLAKANLQPKQEMRRCEQLLNLSNIFPLRIELNRCQDGKNVEELIETAIPKIPKGMLWKRLEKGKVLVLMDGLDEVGDSVRRSQVMREIRDLADRLGTQKKGNYFLVTVRTSCYDQFLGKAGFARYSLQGLTDYQQEKMIDRYYSLWAENSYSKEKNFDWRSHAQDLKNQLFFQPSLKRITNNPFYLSQIASLHFSGEPLPKKTYEVYHQIIKQLITRRKESIKDADINSSLHICGELALIIHKQKGRHVLTRQELDHHLSQAPTQPLKSEDFSGKKLDDLIEQMEKEWGLLYSQKNGELHYNFSNLNFQEYLTAFIISCKRAIYWPILQENLQDQWWEEVVYLYTAMPAQRFSHLQQVLSELVKLDSADKWLKAGRYLTNKSDVDTSPLYQEVLDNLKIVALGGIQDENIHALEVLCQIEPEGENLILDWALSPDRYIELVKPVQRIERIQDAQAKYHLREASLRKLLESSLDGVGPCEVIKKRITLGEILSLVGDTRVHRWVKRELSRKNKTISLMVGKYPVTNAEYHRFVQCTHYRQPIHWEQDPDWLRCKANHPVVNVSFEDATKYCEWLCQDEQGDYRLPTDGEWTSLSTFYFPWGSYFHQYYLNWYRREGTTTPVGIYYEGDTPEGISELLGNVWEWTQGQEGDKYVLRGGAWDSSDLQQLGLQARSLKSPTYKSDNIGFRVVSNPL